jgi:protein SCO1/2
MKLNVLKSSLPILGILAIASAVMLVSSSRWTRSYSFQGSVIEPAQPAAGFELNDQHGQPFRLGDQRGKVVLLFFGYSFCPDVCPTTLADFARIFDGLGASAADVRFVYVSVDPARDTPERLADYVGNFNLQFTALSGSQAELQPVWEAYSVAPVIEGGAATPGYLVSHATRVYLIDKSGNLRLTFPYGLSRDAMAADLDAILKE